MKGRWSPIRVACLAAALLGFAITASAEETPFNATGSLFISDLHGNHLTAVIEEGHANRVGTFTGIIDIVVRGQTSTSMGILETPSGDVIAFVIATQFDPALPGQSGTYVIVGGTGRYEHASGSGVFEAVITGFDPVETLDFAFDGTIDF